jgi:hypothetical protein
MVEHGSDNAEQDRAPMGCDDSGAIRQNRSGDAPSAAPLLALCQAV